MNITTFCNRAPHTPFYIVSIQPKAITEIGVYSPNDFRTAICHDERQFRNKSMSRKKLLILLFVVAVTDAVSVYRCLSQVVFDFHDYCSLI